ncbi:MAG: hypothetical protein WCY12_02145 [Candidatus Omnitrophota bacterium]
MRKFLVLAAAALFICGLFSFAAAEEAVVTEVTDAVVSESKPEAFTDESINITATVESIDQAKREITVKGPEGNLMTFIADASVKNFDQIQKGDTVAVDYYASVAVYVSKAGQAPMAEEKDTVETAALGQKPAGFELKVDEIVAVVTAIDYAKRSITLKGPKGNEMTFIVNDKVKKLEEIKVGDDVVARVTQALAIAVNKPQ